LARPYKYSSPITTQASLLLVGGTTTTTTSVLGETLGTAGETKVVLSRENSRFSLL
jgi:hypothetical protein